MKCNIFSVKKLATICLCLFAFVGQGFAAWDGTSSTEPSTTTIEDKTYYVIANEANLAWFTNQVNSGYANINAILTADLDMGNKAFTPIGNTENRAYKGTFDGNGKTITGLKVEGWRQYVGLFGQLGEGAVVKNLTLLNESLSSTYFGRGVPVYIGGIAGYNAGGSISNCSVGGTSEIKSALGLAGSGHGQAGGIVGHQESGSVDGCTSSMSIDTNPDALLSDDEDYAGGLVGYLGGGELTNSEYTGNSITTINPEGAGGLVGNLGEDATIDNCEDPNYTGPDIGSGYADEGNHQIIISYKSLETGKVLATYSEQHSNSTSYSYNIATDTLTGCSDFSPISVSGTVKKGNTANVNREITCTPIQYAITYAGVDGATHSNATVRTIETGVSLTDASKTGFDFNGWYLNDELITNVPKGAGAVTITAHWNPHKHTVVFKDSSGTIVETRNNVEYHSTVNNFPEAPAKTGYTFKQWNSNQVDWADGHASFTMIDEDVVVFAEYEVNSYTLTWTIGDGATITSADGEYTAAGQVAYGATLVAPTLSRTGYTQNGWDPDVPETMPASASSFTALWTPVEYTIEYANVDGATNPNSASSYTIETENIALQAASKTGFRFDGWTLTDASGDAVTEIAKGSTGNITLYANWTAVYTVTWKNGDETVDTDTDVPNGTMAGTIAPADPTKTGYTFSGWNDGTTTYTTGEDGTLATLMITDNTTFTAQWDANSYDATFDANGGEFGEGAVTTKSVDYDAAITATDITAPTREGYTFKGWALTSDATAAAENLGTMNSTEGVTIYAVWLVKSFTITLEPNGGTLGTGASPITQEYGSEIATRANPTKTGYTFAGWFENQDLSGDAVTIPATMPAKTYTLYAKWTPAEVNYTVKTCTMETDGTYDESKCSTVTKKDLTGASVDATPESFDTGFELDTENSTLTGTVAADGSLALSVYIKRISYTMTFDTKGGNTIDPISGLFGAALVAPADPEKTGYTFSKWDVEIPATIPAENKTFNAVWLENVEVTITGHSSSSTYTGSEQTVEGYDVAIPEGSTYTADKISFTGSKTVAATDAGTYAMGLKSTDFANTDDGYVVTFTVTDGSLTIGKKAVSFKGKAATETYTGSLISNAEFTVEGLVFGHTHNVEAKAEGTEVSATAYAGTITDAASVVIKDASDNDVTANYEITTTAGSLTIEKAAGLTVALDGATFTYDAAAHALSTAATTNAVTGTTAIEYQFGGDAEWTATLASLTKVAAGTYTVNVRATNPNYSNTATGSATLTIDKAAITVNVTGSSSSVKYDGEEHSVSGYTATSESGLFNVGKVQFSGTASAVRTIVGKTDMGLKVADFSYNDVNIAATFNVTDGYQEILAADEVVVTITGHNVTKTYDGTEASATGYEISASSTTFDKSTVSYSGTASAKRTDAGTTAMNLDKTKFSSTDENFSTVTFVIAEDGYVTINKKTAEIVWGSAEFTYTGLAQVPTATVSNLEPGDECTVTVTGAGTDAGNYTATATELSNANYVLPESGLTKVFSIEQATIVVETEGAKRAYNGEALTAGGSIKSGLVNGETATITLTGTQTNVGKSSNTFSMNWGTAKLANYKISSTLGELEVTAAAITVDEIAGATYNGTKQNPIVTVKDANDGSKALELNTDYTVSWDNDGFTNAGDYKVTVTGKGNYTGSETKTYTIAKAKVSVKADDKSQMYGDEAVALTATVTGKPESGTAVNYTLARETGDNVGTYAISVNLGENLNYDITTTKGTYTITKASFTVAGASYDGVYDGANHGDAAVVKYGETVVTDATVEYSTDNGTTWSATVPTIKDVGSKTVKVRANKTNFAQAEDDYTLAVTAREVSLSWTPASFVYDGNSHIPTATAGNVVDGETVTVTVDASGAKTDVGDDYVAEATGLSSTNYKLPATVTTTFSITSATITITANDQWYTYTGSAQQATAAKTDVAGATITYSVDDGMTWSATVPSLTDADTVAVTVKAEKANYTTATKRFSFGVAQANINDVTVAIDDWTYGETAKTPTTSATFKAADEPVVTYSVKGANSWSATVPTAVGEYTVKAAVAETANYVGGEATKDFTIARATATVIAVANGKTYGAEEPTLTAEVTGLKNGDAASVISYSVSRAPGADVGKYTITPSGDAEQGNYNVEYMTADFTITKAMTNNVTVSINNWGYGTTPAIPSFTADFGEEAAYTYSVKGADVWNETKPSAAGEYTIKATVAGTDNYVGGEATKDFTIGEAVINITAPDQLYDYDGSAHGVAVTADVDGVTIIYSYATSTGTIPPQLTDADTIVVEVNATKENYTPVNKTYRLGVAKAKTNNVTVGITGWTYGETAKAPMTSATFKAEGEPAVTYSVKGADSWSTEVPTDAGEYTVKATVAETANYVGGEATQDFTIAPATMTLVVAGYAGTYDGVAHSGTVTPSATTGTTVSYKVGEGDWSTTVPTFTDADTVEVKVKAVNSNYQPVEDSYTVAIAKKAIEVAVSGNSGSTTYDGKDHAVEGFTAMTEETLYDVKSVALVDGKLASATTKNVDKVMMGLTKDSFVNNDNNFTATFTVTDGYSEVTAREVTLSWDSTTFVYNGDAHLPAATAGNVVDGETVTVTVDASGAKTDVGDDYVAEATGLSSTNYKLPAIVTTTFSITPATITITAIDQWYTYTGSAQQATAAKTDVAGATITYSVDDGMTWSATVPSLTDADTVAVTVKAEKANYTTATKRFSFGVAQANINDVTVAIEDWTYGETAKTPTTSATFKAADEPVVTYSVKDADSWSTTVPTDAGEYTVKATVAETANYVGGEATQDFTIKKATIVLTVPDDQWYTYDGKFHGSDARASSEIAGVKITYEHSGTITNMPAGFINADTVEVIVHATKDNYEPLDKSYFVGIEKRAVSFTGETATEDYTGSEIELTEVTADGLVDGHTHNVTYSAKGADVGDYDGEITAATAVVIKDASEKDVTKNYAITTTAGKLTIQAAGTFTITLANDTATYDGAEHYSTKIASSEAVSGETTFQYQFTGDTEWTSDLTNLAKTNAGSYIINVKATNPNYTETATTTAKLVISKKAAKITITAASKTYGDVDPTFAGKVEGLVDDADLGTIAYVRVSTDEKAALYQDGLTATYTENGNYDVTVVPANFTINKRAITLTSATDYTIYDGTRFMAATVEVTAGSYADGESFTYSDFASLVDADSVDNSFNYASSATANVKNYDITVVFGEIGVAKKAAKITVTAAEKTYGDADPTFTGKVEGLVKGTDLGDIAYVRSGDDERAGVHQDELSATYTENGNYDVTVVPANFTINKRAVSFTGETATKDFTGSEIELAKVTVGGDGLVSGHTHNVTYSAKGADVGDYDGEITAATAVVIKDASEKDVTKNYAITTTAGKLTIQAAGTFTITLANDTTTYDGAEHYSTKNASSEAVSGETTFQYQFVGDGETWVSDLTSLKKMAAGEYTINVKASNPNYAETATATAKLIINKKSATITVASAEKTYGDADPTFTGSVEGLVAAADLGTITYSRTVSDEVVGSYAGVIVANFTANDNYEVAVVKGNFTISPVINVVLPEDVELVCTAGATGAENCTEDGKSINHTYGEETSPLPGAVMKDSTGAVDATWHFEGWFENEDGIEPEVTKIDATEKGPVTIYPFFTKELDVEIVDTTITVVIDNNDSKDSVDNKVTDAIRDAGIKDPTKPADSKYSYEFEKYEYDVETGKVTPVFKPTGREYKIVYVMPKAAQLSKEIKTYTYGVGTVLPTASIKGDKDWMFMGWYADEGFIGERTKEITKKDIGKKVLYPMFQKVLRYSTRDESGVISVLYDIDEASVIEKSLEGVHPADYDESGVTYTFSKWVEKNGVYTAEYTEKTGINHRAIANFHVMVSGRTLEISGAKMGAKIAVFDMSGRMVAQGIVENGTTRVDLAKAGSYVVRVNNQVNRVNVR